MSERGSIGVVMAAVVGFALLMAVGLVAVAGVHQARIRARTAADAAALAAAPVTFLPFGATGTPAAEAARFAGYNGARLVECRCPRDTSFAARAVDVRVVTTVDLPVVGAVAVEAVARAIFEPAALLIDP